MALLPPRELMARMAANMAVVEATRRVNCVTHDLFRLLSGLGEFNFSHSGFLS